jgi:hypothetical protein
MYRLKENRRAAYPIIEASFLYPKKRSMYKKPGMGTKVFREMERK